MAGNPLPATLPCDCCPTGAPRCALVGVPFDAVAQTVAQAGWNPVNLPDTIDGNVSGQVNGYNSPSGGAASTTLRVTYTIPAQNRVRGIRLWNQGGSDLGDNDGLGTFNVEFYAGATLLTTLPCFGANGGAVQTFTLPPGQELDGVDRVVLRELGKLSGSTIAPLWREIQLVEVQTVFPCRRRSGALEWYDGNGVLVPTTDLVSCSPPQPLVVSDLTVTGAAFDFVGEPGNTSNADEVLTATPPAASVATGTVLTAPNHYRSSMAAAASSCGGRVIGLTYQPASSFDLAYEALTPGSPVGGVYIQFSAPSLGGALNFGLFNPGTFKTGQSKTIAVPGGYATLTYLQGANAGNNAPWGVPPQCGLGVAGSQVIALHFANTSTADQPMRFNLSFTRA